MRKSVRYVKEEGEWVKRTGWRRKTRHHYTKRVRVERAIKRESPSIRKAPSAPAEAAQGA